ncbi:hypothetical protein [Streptomyces flavidovirens]|uniref:hypothetical protein n=1 Tax=Streptomyces flavidovirens TaxID=67298 RepID=UPI0036C417C0
MPFGESGPRIIAAIETAWEVLKESHPELPEVYVIVDNEGARHNVVIPDRLEADMRLEIPIHRDAITAGPRATLEAILHVATHALCQARGLSETSNRGMRHNKHFRDTALELGMKWPEGEPPHSTRGFSPVPLTPEALAGYAPLIQALGKSLDGVVLGVAEPATKGKSGSRITLQCECTNPPRTFQIGPRIAAIGGITCNVCGAEFTEK